MATNVIADNLTAALSPTLANQLMTALLNGRVRCQVDTITITTSETSGSTIKIGKLKKNDIFLGLGIIYAALGNAVTATIGDGTTADRFGAITTMAAAGKQFVLSSDPITPMTADCYITLTTGGATPDASHVLQFISLIARD